MDQNKCNVCNKSFNSDQELREHQRTAHGGGARKEQDQPGGEQNQNQTDRERKIAS